MHTGPILALDLGKYKSVACVYPPGGGSPTFDTVPASREALLALLQLRRPAVVVIEACASAGWVHDLCVQHGLRCKVANTATEAWRFKHLKRKTDKDDALRLAQLEALGQLPTVSVPPPAVREKRSLILARQRLVGLRVRAQNRLRALLVAQGLDAPRGAAAWSAAGLAVFEQHARPLADCSPEERWRGLIHLALVEYRQLLAWEQQTEAKLDALGKADAQVARLRTVPGVGPRTAEVVAAYLHEPGRFRSGKEVGAYAGLVPRQHQSGECDRRGRITRRGPGVLRKLLVECAWVMLRYNRWAAAVYARLSRGKARMKQAIVAVARRLLVRCWAMLRDGTNWREELATSG
ncbi:MAG: IS110 family transposase [Gemmataceae bacterium]